MIFTNSSFQNSIPDVRTGTFIPPLLGMADILGDKSSPEFVHLLLSLVGVGIYFSIPGILKQVDAALGVDDKLLKQLLTTPFESIKESANVTFKGAPAATARAAQITAGGARNIASAALTTKYRLNKLSDNLNGRDPKAVGNSEYRLREELTANRQKLLSKLQDPNISTIAKVGIRSQLAGLDAKESLLTVSTKGEEGKSQELEFSILYLDGTGGTSRFTYSTAKIKSLENAFGARQTNITENIAKISLKANNYTLESNVNISIGNIAKRSYTNNLGKTVVTTQEEFDSSDPNIMSKWPPGAEIFLANTTWESTSNGSIATGLSPGTKLSFFSSTSDPDPSNGASRNTNGKSVDIIVTFTIASQADFMRLFGTLDVGLSQYVGGLLTDGIQTKKRAFKIENVETGPFRIVIGKSR